MINSHRTQNTSYQMTQLRYATLLAGLLLFHLIQANEDAEISTESLPQLSGRSRHRLSLHRKSRRRKQLIMDSLRSRAEDEADKDVDGEDMEEEEDEEVVPDKEERLLARKKKNSNTKKKNNSNNKKKKDGNNKKRDKTNNNKKQKKKDNDRMKKNPSNKKKKNVVKRKKRKDIYYKLSPDWCLCEDLYGPNYWNQDDDYNDDWSYDDNYYYEFGSTTKRKKYKTVRNKKRRKFDGRLLLSDEDEHEDLQGVESEDEVHLRRHLKRDELIDEGGEEEDSDAASLAEVFAEEAAGEEEVDGGDLMTMRFKKRQNWKFSNNKNIDKRRNWEGGDDWGDDDWSDDEWSDDQWGDDEWGGKWRKPKWCPCPPMPTMMPTTDMPTEIPTVSPSRDPTEEPTMIPTLEPTYIPTMEPTLNPTALPSMEPTLNPSSKPTPAPTTSSPTARRTPSPTQSPTKSTPGLSGEGFFWGEEAAVGESDGQTQSTPERFNNGIPISNITAGHMYTLHLDVSGNAYASGYVEALSAYKGQYGVGDNVIEGYNTNRQVNIVVRNGAVERAPPFERLQAAFDHSAFIDRNGRLYMTGSNNHGKLCLDDDSSMKNIPHLVELPSNRVAVTVALGKDFTLILLDNGRVYGCGSNMQGEIGLGDEIASVRIPTPIGKGLGLGKMKAISAGGDFSLYLAVTGKAYSSGNNDHKQQCRNTEGNPVTTPTEINNAGLSVLGIQGGSASSYLILTDGDSSLFASCGRNNEGQLCGTRNADSGRAKVELDSSIQATGIGSGPTSQTVFFIGEDTTDGTDVVYGCGQNNRNQVGIGSQQTQITTPTRVNFLVNQRFTMEISASTSHTVAFATDFRLPTSTTTTTTGATTTTTSAASTTTTTTTTTTPADTTTTTTTTPAVTTTTSTTTAASTTTTTTTTTSSTTTTTTTTLSPVTITDEASLVAEDGDENFRFGRSVAIFGTSALIGAPGADARVKPEDSDETSGLGAAYLIEDLSTDNKQTKLSSYLAAPAPTPSNLNFNCGHSVALSDKYAVIGCPGFKEFDEDDDSYSSFSSGAISVYTLGFDSEKIPPLNVVLRITNPDDLPNVDAEFGTSVAINSNTIVAVGTTLTEGSVALFAIDGENPNQPFLTLPKSRDGIRGEPGNFGWSVALNDDNESMLAVGAPKQRQNGEAAGSVFLWKDILSDDDPVEIEAPSLATESCDGTDGCQFGYSVALSGNTLVVGSPGTRDKAGRAFVYDMTKDKFEKNAETLPANPLSKSELGFSVAIRDGAIVVGSRKYVVDDNEEVGAAYVYKKDGDGNWKRPNLVDDKSGDDLDNPILGGNGDRFGVAVAVNDKAFIVGASRSNANEGGAVSYSYQSTASLSSNGAVADNNSSNRSSASRSEVIYLETDDCTIGYRVNTRDVLSITVELVCMGVDKWIGIGFSSDGLMQNSEAVLGIPGNDRPIRYALNGKSVDTVVQMSNEEQTLRGASLQVLQNDRTVMKFTKNIENKVGEEIFLLFAHGASSTLGYHSDRTSVKVTI